MEKKPEFKIPGHITYTEAIRLIAEEINKLYSLIEDAKKLKADVAQRRQLSNECTQWCVYNGYPIHVAECRSKGPTGL